MHGTKPRGMRVARLVLLDTSYEGNPLLQLILHAGNVLMVSCLVISHGNYAKRTSCFESWDCSCHH